MGRARLERATALAGEDCGVSELQALLRDHENYPRSICRHPNPDEETGEWISVLSCVMDVSGGTMYCSRGPPCCNEYMRYHLNQEGPAAL